MKKKESIFYINNQFYQIDLSNKWQKHPKEKFNTNQLSDDMDLYIDTPNFSLIPDEIFNELPTDKKQDFITSNQESFSFFNTSIPFISGQLYWCATKEEIEFFNKEIPSCNLHHLAEPLLINNNQSNQLKYFLSDTFIYITCIKDNELKVANRFSIERNEDALYFILSLIKEADLINVDFIFNCHGINIESINKKLKSIFHTSDFIENDFNSILN